MFDIGWGKIIIIAVIALIVIGPKELPAVLRTVGQWMGKIRRMAAEFQNQFQEAMREAEMADLKKSVDAITEATRDIGGGFDPVGTVRKHIEGAFDDKPAEAVSNTTTPSTTTSPVGETAGAVASADAAAAPLPNPAEPELPFPEPAPPVTSRDIVPEPAPATATPAPAAVPDAGGRPA